MSVRVLCIGLIDLFENCLLKAIEKYQFYMHYTYNVCENIFTPLEFFSSVLADGFSLEFE